MKRLRCAVVVFAIIVAICLCLTRQVSAADYVPGEIIVLFDDEFVPAIEPSGEGFATAYQALDEFFILYEPEEVRTLFTSESPLTNVFLLRFSEEEDLDEVIEGLLEQPF